MAQLPADRVDAEGAKEEGAEGLLALEGRSVGQSSTQVGEAQHPSAEECCTSVTSHAGAWLAQLPVGRQCNSSSLSPAPSRALWSSANHRSAPVQRVGLATVGPTLGDPRRCSSDLRLQSDSFVPVGACSHQIQSLGCYPPEGQGHSLGGVFGTPGRTKAMQSPPTVPGDGQDQSSISSGPSESACHQLRLGICTPSTPVHRNLPLVSSSPGSCRHELGKEDTSLDAKALRKTWSTGAAESSLVGFNSAAEDAEDNRISKDTPLPGGVKTGAAGLEGAEASKCTPAEERTSSNVGGGGDVEMLILEQRLKLLKTQRELAAAHCVKFMHTLECGIETIRLNEQRKERRRRDRGRPLHRRRSVSQEGLWLPGYDKTSLDWTKLERTGSQDATAVIDCTEASNCSKLQRSKKSHTRSASLNDGDVVDSFHLFTSGAGLLNTRQAATPTHLFPESLSSSPAAENQQLWRPPLGMKPLDMTSTGEGLPLSQEPGSEFRHFPSVLDHRQQMSLPKVSPRLSLPQSTSVTQTSGHMPRKAKSLMSTSRALLVPENLLARKTSPGLRPPAGVPRATWPPGQSVMQVLPEFPQMSPNSSYPSTVHGSPIPSRATLLASPTSRLYQPTPSSRLPPLSPSPPVGLQRAGSIHSKQLPQVWSAPAAISPGNAPGRLHVASPEPRSWAPNLPATHSTGTMRSTSECGGTKSAEGATLWSDRAGNERRLANYPHTLSAPTRNLHVSWEQKSQLTLETMATPILCPRSASLGGQWRQNNLRSPEVFMAGAMSASVPVASTTSISPSASHRMLKTIIYPESTLYEVASDTDAEKSINEAPDTAGACLQTYCGKDPEGFSLFHTSARCSQDSGALSSCSMYSSSDVTAKNRSMASDSSLPSSSCIMGNAVLHKASADFCFELDRD